MCKMAILDKLIEKKDLIAYTTFREKSLKKMLKRLDNLKPENKRQAAKAKIIGRIQELHEIRKSVNSLKEKSIKYARENK